MQPEDCAGHLEQEVREISVQLLEFAHVSVLSEESHCCFRSWVFATMHLWENGPESAHLLSRLVFSQGTTFPEFYLVSPRAMF